MKRRTLPGTALEVSEVCLGTMTWGQQNTESQAHEQLEYCVSQGINFVDTAEMYPVPPTARTQGRTETYLGNWLGSRPRGELVIATKLTGPGRRDWIRGGRTDLTREVIAEAAQTSLQRLKIDVIDIFQIHWPQRNVPMFGSTLFDPANEREGPAIREQVEAMAALIDSGRIRHYGLSNETTWGVCEFHRVAAELGVPGPVTLQNSYSLLSRNVDGDLAEALFRQKMSLLAYSPLAGGMLSGKYRGGAKPADARFTLFEGFGARFRKPRVEQAIDVYAELAERRGITLVQLALGYVRSRWFLGSAIVGATTMAQLREDVAAAKFELDADTLAEIDRVQERFPNPAA
ncbi:MAG: aldo/keto reductase [Burkholderiaceae bacterium]|nr:aldo/keto reductase [Burkholderiaceae bacterium]